MVKENYEKNAVSASLGERF